ncbi:type II/IV secretion system protein [Candidatus Gracilibacteria bacterium]|nr:type II/IV secretion system protein [Candidatus Gracilibacteria bacterium]
MDIGELFKKGVVKTKPNTGKNVKVEDLFGSSSNNDLKSVKNSINSDLNLNSYGEKKEDGFLISIVNDMFLNAIKLRASDVHIEPNDYNLTIRFRIDGKFINYKDLDIKNKDSVIARIKIMSYLRIDEHRLPQDGKIAYKLFGGKQLDMRVSIIPTIYGEKCVIRILKKDSTPPELKDLGIMPYNMVKIKKHLADNYGMILAVGPTGSGKSTTLFSLLSQFNPKEKNISTLEDPVEYRIPGVNHTQINQSIDFTFARGLRSLLRQDPDIIMVGEIRDEETAKLAVEASITGHIVFSTIHTNSATHTIQRLVNLGVDPLLITSSLRMIISQRLTRKLCPHCKIQYKASDKIKDYIVGKVGKYIKNKEELLLFKSNENGCIKCNHTGYSGRVGLYEVLEITDKLETLILNNASRLQLEIQAIGDGMVPIKDDGLLKVILGETSLEELLSVLGT